MRFLQKFKTGQFFFKHTNSLSICLRCLICALMLSCSLTAISPAGGDLSRKREEKKIILNNRILAIANGKPITTYDLMKKMDLSFFRQFPEYSTSVEARFQYYQFNWKPALSDLIDKQLILADAKESKIEVSSGDVRQEIESAFGPNIIENLDKAGFTYEDAFKMMQDEILIRRLVAGRAHVKAIKLVTPSRIRQSYEEFIRDPSNKRPTQWSYRTLTIKEKNKEKGEQAAKTAYQLLMQGVSPEKLQALLKEQKEISRTGTVTLSNPIKQNENEIASDYLSALSILEPGMISQPFAQKSRTTGASVYRILIVDDKIPGGFPSYREMEPKLKEKIIDEEIDKETDAYLKRLRQHYHIRQSDIEQNLPSNYEPFSLRT